MFYVEKNHMNENPVAEKINRNNENDFSNFAKLISLYHVCLDCIEDLYIVDKYQKLAGVVIKD